MRFPGYTARSRLKIPHEDWLPTAGKLDLECRSIRRWRRFESCDPSVCGATARRCIVRHCRAGHSQHCACANSEQFSCPDDCARTRATARFRKARGSTAVYGDGSVYRSCRRDSSPFFSARWPGLAQRAFNLSGDFARDLFAAFCFGALGWLCQCIAGVFLALFVARQDYARLALINIAGTLVSTLRCCY